MISEKEKRKLQEVVEWLEANGYFQGCKVIIKGPNIRIQTSPSSLTVALPSIYLLERNFAGFFLDMYLETILTIISSELEREGYENPELLKRKEIVEEIYENRVRAR